MLANFAKKPSYKRVKRLFLILTALFALPLICFGNLTELIGSVPFINIERSITGNWQSISTLNLRVDIDTPGSYKVTIAASSFDPAAWQGRYLRVEPQNQADWILISPLATFYPVDLVVNGVMLPTSTVLVRNLIMGTHPFIPLKYESRADKAAVPGSSQLTITLTTMLQ